MTQPRRSLLLVSCLTLAALVVPCVTRAGNVLTIYPAVRGYQTMWRYHWTWQTERCRMEGGALVWVDPFAPNRLVKTNGKKAYELRRTDRVIGSTFPPRGWERREFDDTRWPLRKGPFVFTYRSTAHVALRGRFIVTDPAKAGDLSLSMTYEGGVVVYLNGREVARGDMPGGEVTPETLARDYPKEAHQSPDGGMLRIYRHRRNRKHKDRWAKRVRKLENVKIPARHLVKGVNVLAISLHRAPAVEAMFVTHFKPDGWFGNFSNRLSYFWDRIRLESLSLHAADGAAVAPNVKPPKGVQVWHHDPVQRVDRYAFGEPGRRPYPVRMYAARNGVAVGVVVASSDRPIHGLTVAAGKLRRGAGGEIRAADVRVRYAEVIKVTPHVWFHDRLDNAPVDGAGRVPVWLTVRVPRDAEPGTYAGTLSVSADETKPVIVPVELRVFDWALPDPQSFTTHLGVIQSPDSAAIQYGVPMWSDKHFELIGKSFELLGQVGNKVVYLPLVRRTHFGNEQTMVRWIRQRDGSFTHDFSVVERYLDIAVRHQGQMPVVCLYLWDLFSNPGFGKRRVPAQKLGTGGQSTGTTDGQHFTALDPKTGKLTAFAGPAWGTPEARTFWKPVIDGLRAVLRKRGLEKSMMFGLAGDAMPAKAVIEDCRAIAPDVLWACHSHLFRERVGQTRSYPGQPVGYMATVGGAIGVFWDPAGTRPFYGWMNRSRLVTFARDSYGRGPSLTQYSPPAIYRLVAEGALHSGRLYTEKWGVRKDIVGLGGRRDFRRFPGLRGLGRIGGDFWPVLKAGRLSRSVAGRYPVTAWGTVRLGSGGTTTHLLAAGKDGPVPSVRFEMLRQSLQDAEAVIVIRNALFDKGTRAKLPAALAARCEKLLDWRIRGLRNITGGCGYLAGYGCEYQLSPDWDRSSRALYEAARDASNILKR